jgi:hypothetical protein
MGLSDVRRAISREASVQITNLKISGIIRDVRLKPITVDYLIEPTVEMGKVSADADPVRIVG